MSTSPKNNSLLASTTFAATIIGAAVFAYPASVMAFGGGSPVSCSTLTTAQACQAQSHCKWSGNKCRNKNGNSVIDPDNSIYAKGRLLAKSGEYANAIAVLNTGDQSDPNVLNYLGYSYRKSGDLKTAIHYYKAALAIDPNFVLAREYLGEGYVKAGRIDLAKLELDEIAKRCGKGCKEFVELAAVIDGTDKSTW